MEQPPGAQATQELEALFAAAGLAIPPDLKVGTLAEAAHLRRAAALLRRPRSAAAEPANVFSLKLGRG